MLGQKWNRLVISDPAYIQGSRTGNCYIKALTAVSVHTKTEKVLKHNGRKCHGVRSLITVWPQFQTFPRNCNSENILVKSFVSMKWQQICATTSVWSNVQTCGHPQSVAIERTATVTSSCLQRQEVVGISMFWRLFLFFFSRRLWTNTTTTSTLTEQYSRERERVQHIVLISNHARANEISMPAWELGLAEQQRLGFRNAVRCGVCPRGERMLTHRGFSKSQLQESREDGAQRYCTVFPENIKIAISRNSVFLRRWHYTFIWKTFPLSSSQRPETEADCCPKRL